MTRKIGQVRLKKLQKMCPSLVGSKLEGSSLFLRYPPRHSYSIKHIDTIAATMLKLAEENERLREFTEHALDLCSWNNEPDGGSIQDKAEDLKLIELRPIDPEDAIMDETEQYFCVWTPKAGRR